MLSVFLSLRKAKFLVFSVDAVVLLATIFLLVHQNVFFSLFLSGFILTGLYSFRCYDFTDQKNCYSMVVACITAFLIFSLTGMIFSQFFQEPVHSRKAISLFFIALPILSIFHGIFYSLLFTFLPENKLLVLGESSWKYLFNEISTATKGKVTPQAFVKSPLKIRQYLKDYPDISDIIICDPEYLNIPGFRETINEIMKKGYQVKYLPETAEQALQRIPLQVFSTFGEYYDIELRAKKPRSYSRALDIVASFFLLAVLLPVMIFSSGVVLLTTGMPIIFSQKRTGRNGKEFVMIKFRTMTEDPKNELQATFADENTGRITPFGAFLRKTRIDELPQLWNVLKGEMSLIGPRPEQVEFNNRFEKEIPFYSMRNRLRPGLTGWAQINDGYASSLNATIKKLEYDLYYIKNASPLLDLEIILKTFQTILGMRGSK